MLSFFSSGIPLEGTVSEFSTHSSIRAYYFFRNYMCVCLWVGFTSAAHSDRKYFFGSPFRFAWDKSEHSFNFLWSAKEKLFLWLCSHLAISHFASGNNVNVSLHSPIPHRFFHPFRHSDGTLCRDDHYWRRTLLRVPHDTKECYDCHSKSLVRRDH